MANEEKAFQEFAAKLGSGADPAFVQSSAPPQPGGGYEEFARQLGTGTPSHDETPIVQPPSQPQPEAPKVGYGEDIARATAAGLGRGAISLAGLPGDVESLVDLAREKISGTKPGARYLPTSEELISKAEGLHPIAKQYLSYQPVTGFGHYAKSGAEFIPGALIGGGGGLGARVAGSLGAGLATQAAEDMARKGNLSPEAEMALKIAAGIPGYMAGSKAASIVGKPIEAIATPTGAAKRDLMEALKTDVTTQGKYGAPEGAAAALASGTEMLPGAVGGTATKKLLEQSARRLPEEARAAYQEAAGEMAGRAHKNIQAHIDDMFGRPIDIGDELEAVQRRIRETNEPNYRRVMSMPEMQAIGGPEYESIIKRTPQSVLNNVAENLQMQNIMPEDIGLIKGRGGYQINPQGMPLQFWDELKKGLDGRMQSLKDVSGRITDPSKYTATNELASDLRSQLNTIEPYKQIRNEAAELFGVRDYTQLGEKYFNTTAQNQRQFRSINNVIENASPERKMDFAVGVAGAFKNKLENDPQGALGMFRGKNGAFNAEKFVRALEPLGPDAGYNLIGKSNAEFLNRNIAAIKPTETFGQQAMQFTSQYMPQIGGAAGLLVDVFLTPHIWAGGPQAFMTTLGAYGLGKLYTWGEARKAAKVLELAANPETSVELGKLIAQDPAARSFMTKTNDFLARSIKYPAGAGASMEPRQEGQAEKKHASGGRVERASGGRIQGMKTAEMLMLAAHNAKNRINKVTEQILDQPDEAVVKALEVAKQHI